jgi:signal transduction histidine kinase
VIAVDSLRFRLLAGAIAWVALAVAVAGFVLVGLFREHVGRRFEAELAAHLDQLAAALEVTPAGGAVAGRELSDPRFRRPYSGLYWQVIDDSGAAALRSRSLWDEALRLPSDAIADGELHRHRVAGPGGQSLVALERTVILPGAARPLRLVAAADEAELDAATASFGRTLALSLGTLALALLVAAAVQVEVGLRPLRHLRAALAAVREGRAKRLEGRFPSEVRPLAEDLNALLAHDEAVLARARTQAGNLAHALKTPLSILANEADALAAAGQPGLAVGLRQQLALMRRHIDHHLARARAAGAATVPGARVEVAPRAAALARALARLHSGRKLEFSLEVPPDHVVRGECQDLEEMLGNLMDNACKWARRRVAVGSRREGDRLIIVVDDDGPGLPPERRGGAFAPGARLDEAVPGTGLGLSIARDLAELYGGAVSLADSPLGGLRGELILPAADGHATEHPDPPHPERQRTVTIASAVSRRTDRT